jgi:hypothetical protein
MPTVVAELGGRTRFDSPRQLGAFVGLIPSEDSSGPRRRALIEGAWAYRHPATVSEHIQRRIEGLPKPIHDIGWKAQFRLCRRFRRLTARGKHPNVAVTAIARELIAFVWAIAKEVPRRTRRPHGLGSASGGGPGFPRSPRRRSEAAPADPRAQIVAGALTVPSQVVPNPRISAGSTVGVPRSISALTLVCSGEEQRNER